MIKTKMILGFERLLRMWPRCKERWPLGLITFVVQGHAQGFEIFSHMTVEERCLLYRLSLELGRGARLLEIGSYLGASSCFLAAAARDLGGHLWCVDTWTNLSMSEGPRDTLAEFMTNTKPYQQWVTPVRTKSAAAAEKLDGVFDLIFIDGGHTYEDVATDVVTWAPRLAAGGWIILHDTGWAEGVQRVVKEMIEPQRLGDPILLPNMYAARLKPQPPEKTD